MEGFRYLNSSYNPSSDMVLSLLENGPVNRLLSCYIGSRKRCSWIHEEDLLPGHGPCTVELGDHDSSFFRSLVEPHVDLEFDSFDSNVEDSVSSTLLPELEFPDESEPAKPQNLSPDIAVEEDDLVAALSKGFPHYGILGERLRSFVVGLVVHLLGICLFLSIPAASPKGLGGISFKPIFVKLHEGVEIDTPDLPSRPSVDSPASAASIARRQPKEDEKKPREESMKEEQTPVEEPKKEERKPPARPEKKTLPEERTEEVTERPESEPRPIEEKPAKEPVLAREMIRPDASVPDGPRIESKSSQDSVASMPSVAVQEKKSAVKAGAQVDRYKDKILAAIHRAAYYPRAALRKMAHGKAVVSFTVNKDGSLADVSIVGHSQSKALDEAAVKIVHQAASHFPPIPDELMKDHVTFVIPIVFKRRG